MAIRRFRHAGLARFYATGSRAGIPAAHVARLARILGALNAARTPHDLALPGLKLHPLKGRAAGR